MATSWCCFLVYVGCLHRLTHFKLGLLANRFYIYYIKYYLCLWLCIIVNYRE